MNKFLTLILIASIANPLMKLNAVTVAVPFETLWEARSAISNQADAAGFGGIIVCCATIAGLIGTITAIDEAIQADKKISDSSLSEQEKTKLINKKVNWITFGTISAAATALSVLIARALFIRANNKAALAQNLYRA